ncbi:3-hydroxyacyl-CoA dehydrogenase [Saccharopolyspora erythraea NRRL 2338]|uniref:3-hydroxyacyl-CoA dehydrogenase n=2 Tax=Saccharopolyspora erythraea TaxID=1836 RepID=A4FAY8_SACEN|nr:3-hydroxybutyryl-CoA dehydrogenase [Saccharopolyspora erythraea]EQD87594.1 3-hydroxybutyryl-CoA dehydrogenase [Saccharopolyspora erythraea D]PFG94997.1 3-hydroxyacyl-CoA dehydrogenase [Saccharopolyspora erythraea NRRL 2338]QRK91686.1 3-hydroxybutyryl-CoA dehydrogenase [Saccharopolyspora erythraea]CAM01213.1 3-hydroxyacyl-CoA dehydrogenase [Saccharopolyspora erythraea NRRL 2338]
MTKIERLGVVGAGLMGSGIAEVSALAGLDVIVVEVTDDAARAGRSRLWKSLNRAVDKGKITEQERDAAQSRLHFTTTLHDLDDRQLVIEAIAEDAELKTKLFEDLDKIVGDPDAILASNTSSIPIAKLAAATERPAQVMGIHFFNPVPVLKLVELVPSLLTSEETVRRASDFATEQLGKQTIRATDRSGFVVNALLVPYLLSAIRMLEGGHATAEDIDNGMVLGCAHPMGPLALSDLVGLDTLKAIADSMHEEYKEPLYAAPPLLQRMVDAGLKGKKSGKGFYDYS